MHVQEILKSGCTDDLLCDIGMPVVHRGTVRSSRCLTFVCV
jgi:hypothetical protein